MLLPGACRPPGTSYAALAPLLPYYQRAARQKLAVARVHSGDPSLWGAIQEQLEQCHELGLDPERTAPERLEPFAEDLALLRVAHRGVLRPRA